MSGLLHESNLVMYDKKTESLWSQSKGASIVGDFVGTELKILAAQNITVGDVRDLHPDALILSEDTGHTRDYRENPYAGYEQGERLIAPVSRSDDRFPAKTIMFVFRIPDGPAVAIPYDGIPQGISRTYIGDHEIVLELDGPEKQLTVDGMETPGYLEMWFSFIAQHGDNVDVWQP